MGKISKIKHEFNPEFDRLMAVADMGVLSKDLSHFMTRPAYYGTSMAQKNIYKNPCEGCSYWIETEIKKKVCSFPMRGIRAKGGG